MFLAAVALGNLLMKGKNVESETSVLDDSSSDLTTYITTQQSDVIINPFSNQQFTFINDGVLKCKNIHFIQTNSTYTYLKQNLDSKFTANIKQQLKSQVNQLLSAQDDDISGFLSSLDAKNNNISKQHIQDIFNNAINTTITTQNLNSIRDSTVSLQTFNFTNTGTIEGKNCVWDQHIGIRMFVVNLMKEYLNNVLNNQTSTQILQKYYSYIKSDDSGLFSGATGIIIIVVIFIFILLIIAGLYYYFKKRNSNYGYDDDFDDVDDDDEDDE